MELFKEMEKQGHEQVIFFQEKKTGLKAVVAIHDTTLGPSLGGCRMWPYKSEEEAVQDALKLSKGMTYKAAIAGEDFGGGKTVLWADPETDKSEGLFRALGRFIHGLNGRYSTGTDVGTTYDDFVWLRKETPYVGALPKEYGGSGDSSISTAYGVYHGIKACAQFKYGSSDLKGKKVAIQGLGKVGSKLARHLLAEGCQVYGTDINQQHLQRAKEMGVEIVGEEEIYELDVHIFSPNALGGVINEESIAKLKCEIVAGAANNVLADPKFGRLLQEKGILYAPDYVINGGGLIQVADELSNEKYDEARVMKKCEGIYDQLLKIFTIAQEKNISTSEAANHLAEERMETIRQLKTIG